MYVWDTSGDERVRESHAVMEGLLCRWDDATVCSYDGGRTWKPRPSGAVLMHPGMDYQCRCCADAYFNELLDEADGVESGEGYAETTGGPTATEQPKKEPKKPLASIPKKFIPATSIEEANNYAMNVLEITHADYKGIDLAAANEWNKGLSENFKKFPELKERFGFVGETHARNMAAKKKYFDVHRETRFEYLRKLNPGITDEILAPYVDEILAKDWRNFSKNCGLSVSKYDNAASWSPTGWAKEFSGITVNKDNAKSLKVFEAQKALDVESKFHPVGCGTLKATLDHEVGHQIDSLLDLRKDSVILDLWKGFSKNKATQGDELSWYAGTNINEFIAEAWAEYCNNPNPRPTAKAVGERAEEVYKLWKSKK